MRVVLVAVALVASLIPRGAALACGCCFYEEENLLGSREATLGRLPYLDIRSEVRRLGSRVIELGAQTAGAENEYYEYAEAYENYAPAEFDQRYAVRRTQQEQRELTPEQFEQVKALRVLGSGAEAEAQGMNLPAELRYYVAGAVALAQGDAAAATRYFQQVLSLPADQRRTRSTWAAYSLGRALAGSGANQQARAAFQRVRESVAAGFADPLNLGIASLGEEARIEKQAGRWGPAIRFYAAQAQHGSRSGNNSLRRLAAELFEAVDGGSPLLEVPEVQELLAVFVLSNDGMGPVLNEKQGTIARLSARIAERSREQGLQRLAHADRFAALAYRVGDYTSAKQFSKLADDGGLAWWVRARLAVRDGDLRSARAAYARAVKDFPSDESWAWNPEAPPTKPRCRIEAELAVLTLARGEFTNALEQLYAIQEYRAETVELAQRVLTVDELKAFVDARQSVRDGLDAVLGQRLMRAGRYAQALAYFSGELQQSARAYAEHRRAAESRWTQIGRAEALYRAAAIAHQSGSALLGGGVPARNHTSGPWFTRQEVERRVASSATPQLRDHFRDITAELAARAADHLPPRSQAFAAVLCNATGWSIRNDPEKAQAFYRRYLKQGPYVPWGAKFGQDDCPQPNFSAAVELQRRQQWRALRLAVRPYKWPILGAGMVLLGAAVGLVLRRVGLKKGGLR